MTDAQKRKLHSKKAFADAFNLALFDGIVNEHELEKSGFDYSNVKNRQELEKAKHLFSNVVCYSFRGCDLIMIGLDRKDDLILFEMVIKGLYGSLCYLEQIEKLNDPSKMRPVAMLTAYFGKHPYEDR